MRGALFGVVPYAYMKRTPASCFSVHFFLEFSESYFAHYFY